jgi:hypothetical protein
MCNRMLRYITSIHILIYGFNMTVLHYITIMKCVNGCPKIVLDTGLVTDVKLQVPGLHAVLIKILSICFLGIFGNQELL